MTDKLVALYDKLIATLAGVERKGATIPYTSCNGHMFSNLTKDGTLSLRLPPVPRAELMKKHKLQLAVEYGHVRAEYVAITPAVLAKTAALAPYFAASFAYVNAMKPKPTKKTQKR
jgi:hypothetical protein